MSTLDRKVKRLQRRNSKTHAVFLFVFLFVVLGLAFAIRYYAIEPVQLADSSMSPKFKERSIVWMCELPQCLSNVKELDVVLAKLDGGDKIVRKVLALPGDTISISDRGRVVTPHRNFKWKNEEAFIQSRAIYVPKIGDTLYFDSLNDVEQDYLVSYLRAKGERIHVKTTLWQGDHELGIERIGATKIANRQVSLKEIDFLPWQDRYLVELQIRRSEPGNAPIHLKRELYRLSHRPPPPPMFDSAKVALDSNGAVLDSAGLNPDSTMAPPPPPPPTPDESERIDYVVIDKDCFFLACEKGASCPDSRELGYFTQDQIIGHHIKQTETIRNKIVNPATSYLRGAEAIASDLWHAAISMKDSLISKDSVDDSETKESKANKAKEPKAHKKQK